ncbi:hypothetical protein chiPu_0010144 [Chiloscyllium punctatum]|uniref:Uncharacterized protein n=1 Tax=Chiloscyllium punctatum TaxID=137246 RepID=A0A401SMT4_CHIPU|nr:hypothetical protein [Chiloscyllium punctatum]
MDAARKPGEAVPQIGILPHIYTSDPNRERQNATVRRGRNLQSSDYKRTKLPALETETPTNVNESSVISLLESRVKSVEDANQSLREEVVQLQHELKQIGTKATNFQDQHSPWLAIMDTIKASNDMITQLVSRLKETENMLYFEKESIESLLSHMRQLDDDITDQQEEMKRHKIDLEHRGINPELPMDFLLGNILHDNRVIENTKSPGLTDTTKETEQLQ